MTELDSLTWHVMDALADDWESIEQIRPHVHRYAEPASDEAIIQILRRLHEIGLVTIMDAEGYGVGSFPAQASDCWFSMTERGRLLWDAEGEKYRDD
jgi:hypothetical protein